MSRHVRSLRNILECAEALTKFFKNYTEPFRIDDFVFIGMVLHSHKVANFKQALVDVWKVANGRVSMILLAYHA